MPVKSVGFLSFASHKNCYYTQQFRNAFERKGIATHQYIWEEGHERDVLNQLFFDRPDFLMGVAISGQDPILMRSGYRTCEQLQEELPLICDYLKIPYIGFQLDPPVNFQHYYLSDNAFYAHFDRLICKSLKKTLPKTIHIPYAVDPHLLKHDDLPKKYPLTFLGCFYDIDLIEKHWQNRYPKTLITQMLIIVEQLQQNPHKHLMQLMNDLWDYPEINSAEIYCQIELYLRAVERWEMIKQFREMPLHVFGGPMILGSQVGRSWIDVLKGVNVHNPVSYLESLQIMRQSQIVLNSCPVFIEGTHDRVMNGLACGAAIVTNKNAHTYDLFKENLGVMYFQMHHWQSAIKQVNNYIQNPELRQQAVLKGQNILKNETWDHRVESLLDELKCYL